jgi:predicted nucleotidyltransferase
MKKSLNKVLGELRLILPTLKQDFNVDGLELFGSYVSNKHNNNSDVDILVTFSKTPGLLKFIELENHLSDYLKLKVDLVMKNAIKPSLINYILPDAIQL